MLSAKVSTKHQISIPSEARRRWASSPATASTSGCDDDTLVLRKRPAKASDRLRGLGAGKGWYEPDPVTYLRRLRDEFEENLREREALVHRGPARRIRRSRSTRTS